MSYLNFLAPFLERHRAFCWPVGRESRSPSSAGIGTSPKETTTTSCTRGCPAWPRKAQQNTLWVQFECRAPPRGRGRAARKNWSSLALPLASAFSHLTTNCAHRARESPPPHAARATFTSFSGSAAGADSLLDKNCLEPPYFSAKRALSARLGDSFYFAISKIVESLLRRGARVPLGTRTGLCLP